MLHLSIVLYRSMKVAPTLPTILMLKWCSYPHNPNSTGGVRAADSALFFFTPSMVLWSVCFLLFAIVLEGVRYGMDTVFSFFGENAGIMYVCMHIVMYNYYYCYDYYYFYNLLLLLGFMWSQPHY